MRERAVADLLQVQLGFGFVQCSGEVSGTQVVRGLLLTGEQGSCSDQSSCLIRGVSWV